MAKRAYKWVWNARIKPESLLELRQLAESLGFIVETPGQYEGTASAPALLDALAAAYQRDPGGVRLAFKVLGVTPNGQPAYTSENTAESAAE